VKKDKKFFYGHSRLIEEREKIWSTQQQAADYFGVSRVTWGQCERGNATPSGDVLAGLADMGADVHYILTGQRSQAVAEVDLLPSDERVLVDAYRHCNVQAKQALIQTAALLSAGMAAPSKAAKASKSVKLGGSVSGNAVVVAGTVAGGIANGRKK
jgi:DNA-binding XRE family transcriptional regulator